MLLKMKFTVVHCPAYTNTEKKSTGVLVLPTNIRIQLGGIPRCIRRPAKGGTNAATEKFDMRGKDGFQIEINPALAIEATPQTAGIMVQYAELDLMQPGKRLPLLCKASRRNHT